MKKFKVHFIFLMAIALFELGSCKTNKDEFSGPKQGYASQNFAIVSDLQVTKDSVNFLKDTLIFRAKFNEKVSYTLTISGTQSGAVKHLEGLSDSIHAIWDGSADLVFFRKGEACSVKLTVLGKGGVISIRSVIIQTAYKPKGLVIANMEPASVGGSYAGCGFWQPGGQIACGLTDGIPALEGSYAMIMEGKDLNASQYIGQSASRPIFAGQGSVLKPGDDKSKAYVTKTSNPDSLWFTIFIYGTGQKDAQLYIKFDQDDDSNGGNEPASENGFELQILDLSHFGWKSFSYNYSSINLGGNTSFGGNGDGVHRPDKIVQIEYALWSKRPNVPVRVVFDYPIFTVGKPFGQ